MKISPQLQKVFANFRQIKLSTKFSSVFVIASTIVLALFFIFAFLSQKDFEQSVIAQNQDQLLSIANTAGLGVSNLIEQHLSVLETVASNPAFKQNMNKMHLPSSRQYQADMLLSIYDAHEEDEAAIYLLDANGGFIFRYPEDEKQEYYAGFDMTDRPGVAEVIGTKQAYVTEVFLSYEGDSVIALLLPIMLNDELVGILRWLEKTDDIIDRFIKTANAGGSGYIWLSDEKGKMLYHPDPEWNGGNLLSLHSGLDPKYDWTELEGLIDDFNSSEEGVSRYHDDARDSARKLTAYAPIEMGGLSWVIGATTSYSEVIAPVKDHLTKTIWFVFVEVLLIVLGGYVFIRISLKYVRKEESEKAAVAIKEKDDKYQELFESSPGIIVVLGLDGVIMDVNKDYRDAGFPRQEIVGRHFSEIDIFSEENLKEYKKLFAVIAKGVDVGTFEIEIQSKAGLVSDIEIFSSPLKKDGRICAIQFVARDISERRKAERDLKESQKMLEMVMGTIPQYIFWKDLDLEFIGCNENFAKLLGFQSPDEIIGKNDFDVVKNSEDAKFFREQDCQVIESNKPLLHYIRKEKGVDGKTRWLDVNKVPLTDSNGEVVGILGCFEDITERVQAEEALKESEKNLKKAQQIAHLGGWEWDLKDNTFILSEEACKILGRDSKNGQITTFHGLVEETVHSEDKKMVLASAENIARKSQGDSITFRIVRSNKEIRWIAAMAPEVRSFDAKGNPRVVIGTVQDITNLREAELALRESEIRFRELFKNMSSGVAIYEARGEGEEFVFTDINAAAEKIEHLQKAHILGKKVEDVFPGIVNIGLLDVFKRVWKTGKPESFPMYLYKDGRIEGWRKNYVYKLPTGEIVSVYDDLTEQKVAEEKLVALYKHLAFINRRVSILSDIHTHDYSFSEEQTINLIVTSARSIAQAEVCLLYRISEEDSSAKLLASDGDITEQQKNHIENLFPGSLVFLQNIVETNMRVQGKFDEYDFDKLMLSKEIKSFIALPLIVEEDLKGFLMLGFSGDRDITTQDLDFYSVFVTRIASFL